jgi:hypothetical protein
MHRITYTELEVLALAKNGAASLPHSAALVYASNALTTWQGSTPVNRPSSP